MSDAKAVPPRNENILVYPYALWGKGLEEPGLLVVRKLQMEIMTTSWRNL